MLQKLRKGIDSEIFHLGINTRIQHFSEIIHNQLWLGFHDNNLVETGYAFSLHNITNKLKVRGDLQ